MYQRRQLKDGLLFYFCWNKSICMRILASLFIALATSFFLLGCIGDDFILDNQEPELRITNPLDTLALGATHDFAAVYFNNIGEQEPVTINWSSSDESIVSIQGSGTAEALQLGEVTIQASYNNGDTLLTDMVPLAVGENTVGGMDQLTGTVQTTSSYVLTGDFTLTEMGDDVVLEFFDDYVADSGLPGLYIYMSNNANSVTAGYEIGPVTVFSGAHSYVIPSTSLLDYKYVVYFCKPFNVKVGHGEINM